MASKAKSGLSAVRMFPEDIVTPPNTYTPGAPFYLGQIADGQGQSRIHAGVNNNVTGVLRLLQSWTPNLADFVVCCQINTVADPGGSGLFIADIDWPVTRKYVKVVFVGTLGANFQLGAYFLPRVT